MLTDRPPLPRLPVLGSLRAFEAAARLGGMVAAAAELNVTHGAISKQVQALETELGVQLFERRNRGVHLTPRGRWLADRLAAIFGELHRTMRDFHRLDREVGPLTVSCEPTLCLRLLIPALGELKQATGLDIRVQAAGGPVDFVRDHIDVAIRRSDFTLPRGVQTMTLTAERIGPVMRPDLVDVAADHLPRLVSETRAEAWRHWKGAGGAPFGGPEILFQHFYLAIQAAEAGQGAAMASVHMVTESLSSGRLCAPHGFLPDGTRYLALWLSDIVDPRRDALVAWLAARLDLAQG